jgi:hypothetical protein
MQSGANCGGLERVEATFASRLTRKLWRTGELLALTRSRGARPPRPCSSAPSPMSLLPTPTRRARRPPRHARARVVPETVRSTNLAVPVIPSTHPPTRGFRGSGPTPFHYGSAACRSLENSRRRGRRRYRPRSANTLSTCRKWRSRPQASCSSAALSTVLISGSAPRLDRNSPSPAQVLSAARCTAS